MKKKIVKKLSVLFAVSIILTNVFSITTMAVDIENNSLQESTWDYSQKPAGYENANWSYEYEMQDYGYEKLVGAYYMGEYYSYLYDNSGMIYGMADAAGNEVVKYTYDENGIVAEVLSLVNGEWIPNEDDNFIGNQNKMLSAGYFYDENTSCYYIYGRYYNPVLDKYMDGVDNVDLYITENPFCQNSEEGMSPLAAADSDAAARAWAERCLESNNYGLPKDYSASWYGGLSSVDLLARAIYCEGGTTYTSEEDAVAWVILNRIYSSSFPSSATAVVKQSGQFASITGTSGNTENARIPATGTERWRHSTYLACLLLTTTSISEWASIVGDTIDGQLYFYSYTSAKNAYNKGSCPFSGTTSSSLKYNGTPIKNVYVLIYGKVTSFTSLFSNYSPTAYSRNIFYDLK